MPVQRMCKIVEKAKLNPYAVSMTLEVGEMSKQISFGQFINIKCGDGLLLRRPISIHFVDVERNEVWFLIQLVGDGTKRLGEARKGDIINVVLPLGNGFTLPEKPSDKLLLVGGGVGTAPMLYLGEQLDLYLVSKNIR